MYKSDLLNVDFIYWFWQCHAEKKICTHKISKLSDDFLKLNLSAFNCSMKWKRFRNNCRFVKMESRLYKGVTSWLRFCITNSFCTSPFQEDIFFFSSEIKKITIKMTKRSNWVRFYIFSMYKKFLSKSIRLQVNAKIKTSIIRFFSRSLEI